MRAWIASPRGQAIVVAALAAAVFAPSVTYDFVYDDVFIISSRPLLHSLANWREILVSSWWDVTLYRPLTQMMFALEWAAWMASVAFAAGLLLYGEGDVRGCKASCPEAFAQVRVLLYCCAAAEVLGLCFALETARLKEKARVGRLFQAAEAVAGGR